MFHKNSGGKHKPKGCSSLNELFSINPCLLQSPPKNTQKKYDRPFIICSSIEIKPDELQKQRSRTKHNAKEPEAFEPIDR